VEDVPATCVTPGRTGVKICGACGEIADEGTEVPATGVHSYTEFVETVPATCSAKGYDVYKCATCTAKENKNYTEGFDANNHVGPYSDVEDVPATCVTPGRTGVKICGACGEIADAGTEVPATGVHSYTVFVENVPATCCAKGYDVYKCETCTATENKNYTEDFDTNNHVGDTEVRGAVSATCAVEGYTGDTWCLGCETKIADGESTGYAAHQLAKTEAVAATCRDTGFKAYWQCTECGKYFLTEDAATPLTAEELAQQGVIGKTNDHTPGEAAKENEVAATCTTDGGYDLVIRCTVCGALIDSTHETIPAGHTAGEITKENETAPTCTEPGSYEAAVYCTECGEEISRKTVTVPAKGHTWGEWEVVTPATEETDGEAKRVCTVCGAEETKPLSAIGDEITKTVKFVNIDKMHYELDLGDGETYEIYNSSTVQWISRQALRFKVFTYAGFNYDDIIIRANGTEIEPDADGYYSLPQTADAVIVTAEGAVKDDSAPGGKLSFWELLIRFFQKIVAFFSAAFGKN
jgi:hypothetical protein